MEAIQAILTRKSIRNYSNEVIPEDLVNTLLHAAMQAPSAHNYQPWHFIVIKDRNILNEIPKFHPYSKMLKQANLAITVCGDQTIESSLEYNALDCAAATENLLIAAHALGLGAVWLGIYPRQERIAGLRNLLKIPDHVTPITLISIGYPDEDKANENRFKGSHIHLNTW
jgi:nitroreductase